MGGLNEIQQVGEDVFYYNINLNISMRNVAVSVILLSTLGAVLDMAYPISLPDLNSSKNVTSGFFSTISLKDAAMATATSMIAPNPEIRISAWKISSGLSILPRYSMSFYCCHFDRTE